MDVCEMSLYIISNTNDGDNLSPLHLYIVQEALNGNLTKKGEKLFREIYKNIKSGYTKPWFHGIENLTEDHLGYIYWREKEIEHFNPKWMYSSAAKKEAKELERRCKILEKNNIEINCGTVIWKWKDNNE